MTAGNSTVPENVVDLRSDTVTRPTAEMRAAMAEAEVGDDVYGEDPTVNRLEAAGGGNFRQRGGAVRAYRMHGQSDRDQGVDASRRRSDLRRARSRESCMSWRRCRRLPVACRAWRAAEDGLLTWKDIEAVIRPKIYYDSQTALVCLENTLNMWGGTVVPDGAG